MTRRSHSGCDHARRPRPKSHQANNFPPTEYLGARYSYLRALVFTSIPGTCNPNTCNHAQICPSSSSGPQTFNNVLKGLRSSAQIAPSPLKAPLQRSPTRASREPQSRAFLLAISLPLLGIREDLAQGSLQFWWLRIKHWAFFGELQIDHRRCSTIYCRI